MEFSSKGHPAKKLFLSGVSRSSVGQQLASRHWLRSSDRLPAVSLSLAIRLNPYYRYVYGRTGPELVKVIFE